MHGDQFGAPDRSLLEGEADRGLVRGRAVDAHDDRSVIDPTRTFRRDDGHRGGAVRRDGHRDGTEHHAGHPAVAAGSDHRQPCLRRFAAQGEQRRHPGRAGSAPRESGDANAIRSPCRRAVVRPRPASDARGRPAPWSTRHTRPPAANRRTPAGVRRCAAPRRWPPTSPPSPHAVSRRCRRSPGRRVGWRQEGRREAPRSRPARDDGSPAPPNRPIRCDCWLSRTGPPRGSA